MSKVTTVVCAAVGGALTGVAAEFLGPLGAAGVGAATNAMSKVIGAVEREEEVLVMYQTKPESFEKLVAEAGKRIEKKKTSAPDKGIAERILAAQTRIEAAQARIEAAEIEKKAKGIEAEALQAETKAAETKKSGKEKAA